MQQLKLTARAKAGFTLIELSLSIAFIAILSLIVVIMISNAVSSFHKGLTLNQVNTSGMDLVDSIRTAIQGSPAKSPINECASIYSSSAANDGRETPLQSCEKDSGLSFVYNRETATSINAPSAGVDMKNVPIYGTFCTGAYSFIWNSGYLFNNDYKIGNKSSDSTGVSLRYSIYDGDGNRQERENRRPKLLKIQDEDRLVCKLAAGYKLPANNASPYNAESTYSAQASYVGNPGLVTIDISANPVNEEPIDLLAGSNTLAIYDLTAALPAENSIANNAFYSLSLVLGTIQGGINITATGNSCVPPEETSNQSALENFDYCAINKFNFAALAAGG